MNATSKRGYWRKNKQRERETKAAVSAAAVGGTVWISFPIFHPFHPAEMRKEKRLPGKQINFHRARHLYSFYERRPSFPLFLPRTVIQNLWKAGGKYWANRSSVRSHRSLIRLLRTARFASAHRRAHSLARTLTHSLWSSWDSGISLSNFRGFLNHCASTEFLRFSFFLPSSRAAAKKESDNQWIWVVPRFRCGKELFWWCVFAALECHICTKRLAQVVFLFLINIQTLFLQQC